MFLYPLAIVLILLSLGSPFFNDSKIVYATTITLTLFAALPDFFRTLCPLLEAQNIVCTPLIAFNAVVSRYLPMSQLGLGWLLPAAIGFGAGIILNRLNRRLIHR